jgi:hypothetical protein
MDAAYREHPEHPLVQYQALVSRGMQGRFDEAYELARKLARHPTMCAPARDWLRGWLDQPDLPARERSRVQELTSRMHCPDTR